MSEEKWRCDVCGRIIYAERSPLKTSNNEPLPECGDCCNIDRSVCRGQMKLVEEKQSWQDKSKWTDRDEVYFQYGILKGKEEEREKIYKWLEEWFDEKRKSNDLWRIDQEDLIVLLLDNFRKEFKVEG